MNPLVETHPVFSQIRPLSRKEDLVALFALGDRPCLTAEKKSFWRGLAAPAGQGKKATGPMRVRVRPQRGRGPPRDKPTFPCTPANSELPAHPCQRECRYPIPNCFWAFKDTGRPRIDRTNWPEPERQVPEDRNIFAFGHYKTARPSRQLEIGLELSCPARFAPAAADLSCALE